MKLSQTSFISFLLSTILLFYAMKKIHILILSVITFTCFSCQKQNPKTQLEEIAINFCESFLLLSAKTQKGINIPPEAL